MRYVGDMLAWVHQVIAAEREFLESLFGVKGDGRMVGSVRTFQVSEEEEWIRELMDSAVGKLCVPLKVGAFVHAFLFVATVLCVGPCATDSAIPGKQHHFVQDCELTAVLYGDNASNHRRRCTVIQDIVRVGLLAVPFL
jgi:hypothetical protein